MALPQLPAHVVHKLGQHSRVIQEFLSTENMQKRAVLPGRLSFVHTVYPIFKVHSSDFFSNIFFSMFACFARVGKKFLSSLRVFSMFWQPKHFCVLRPQHRPCRCFSLFIAPEWYSGAFSRKSTFLKIGFLFIFSLPSPILPTDEREKTERTTAQLSVTKKWLNLKKVDSITDI